MLCVASDLHEGVYADDDIRPVDVEHLGDLARDKGGCGRHLGLVHEARLRGVEGHPPQGLVLHQEAVALGHLVEWEWRVVLPCVHH